MGLFHEEPMSRVLRESENSWMCYGENTILILLGRGRVRRDSRSKYIFNSEALSAWERTWGLCSLQNIVGGQGVCGKVKLLTYTRCSRTRDS